MYQMPEVVEKGLNDLEYNLISALRRLSSLKKKKIGFLQGHGELNQYETKIARLLIAPYYNIQDIYVILINQILNGIRSSISCWSTNSAGLFKFSI